MNPFLDTVLENNYVFLKYLILIELVTLYLIL